MSEIVLTGLRADNPLAFLAALGTLRVLTLAEPDDPPRMGWTMHGGAWRPVVKSTSLHDAQAAVRAVYGARSRPEHLFPADLVQPALRLSPLDKRKKPRWAGRIRFPLEVFRAYLGRQAYNACDERTQAYAPVWGSELRVKEYDGKECVEPTPLDFTAGNQKFCQMVTELADALTLQHVDEALFGPWKYKDEKLSFRWDPMEDRRYALSARDPSGETVVTVWGANWLALEGLPLLPIVPNSRRPHPVCVRQDNGTIRLRWPVWEPRITCEAVRSLLVQYACWPNSEARARGIVTVFESVVVQPTGYYRNFSPARALE